MSDAHPLYINKVEEHLDELTKYKKGNYEITQAIKNGFLFSLNFLHSTHLVDHRAKNYLTSQGPLRTSLFYSLPKTYIPYLLLPHSVSYISSSPSGRKIKLIPVLYFK